MHTIALELGMTVSRLEEEMTYNEFAGWLAYFRQRDREPEQEVLTPADVMNAFGGG